MDGDLRLEALLHESRQRLERHPERVRRLLVKPRITDREHVDPLRAQADGGLDRRVVGNAAVHQLTLADGYRREDAGDRAAREQRGNSRPARND